MASPLPAFAALALLTGASPLFAQTDLITRARSLVEAHRVDTRTSCGLPVPATWNAPLWEQEAANRRRQAFNRCLDGVMEREQERLQELTYRVDDLRAGQAAVDWSGVNALLDAKWAELEQVETKLRIKENWANTAVEILDIFTGPGAVYDSSPLNPTRQAYPSYQGAYQSPSAYSNPYSRRDTSVSARGVK